MPDSQIQLVVVGLSTMSVDAVRAVCARLHLGPWPLLAVLPPGLSAACAPMLPESDRLELPGSVESLGRSLGEGVVARPHARAWVLVPGDVEHADESSLRAVVKALADSPIAHAQLNGRRCYPAAFVADLFSELARLRDDEGLRRLLSRYPTQAVAIAEAEPSGYPLSEYGSL